MQPLIQDFKGHFDIVTMSELVLASRNWKAEERLIESQGRFFTFFQADGKRDEDGRTLTRMMEIFNRSYRVAGDVNESGFVVFEQRDVQENAFQRLTGLGRKGHERIVGAVFADAKTLQAHYAHAKGILRELGVCRTGARQFILDDADDHYVTVKHAVVRDVSVTDSAKNTVKFAGDAKILTGEQELSVTREAKRSKTVEFAREDTVGTGAVRSAFLINSIARELKLPDLHHLRMLAHRIDALGQGQPDAVKILDIEIDGLEKGRSAIFNEGHEFLKGFVSWIQRDCENVWGSQEELAIAQSLGYTATLIASDLKQGRLTDETFKRIDSLAELANTHSPGAWHERSASFLTHAAVLGACYSHHIDAMRALKAKLEVAPVMPPEDLDPVFVNFMKWSSATNDQLAQKAESGDGRKWIRPSSLS